MAEASGLAVPPGRRWLRIAVYYLVAVALSALARLSWHTNDVGRDWPTLAALGWHLLSGIGPIVGACIVWAVFRPARTMAWFGAGPRLAIAMLALALADDDAAPVAPLLELIARWTA